MGKQSANHIVWIDCEMTGLDLERDRLVEIAVVVTDFELRPLAPGLQLVINPGSDALANMNDFVRKMHTKSGLLPEISAGLSPATAQEKAISYLAQWQQDNARPLVAGNTIGTDRAFLSRYMPQLHELLHYRSIDVSTIKELGKRWHPEVCKKAPVKTSNHRALDDILESIAELAYYRENIFVSN
ncbi:oligoribonuclease [Canibacter sp. lx-72]|uniref:oligoribonuclease n=1 Tax=Canibacter zhuwentaonis TaxID=2837491 RepID=UPI001BDBC06D|nr:oligoribonuclease [Canibacter zhuwentaonis]MBT1017695.1 oligoribonuclease [Canibacter zhuwentaonis]